MVRLPFSNTPFHGLDTSSSEPKHNWVSSMTFPLVVFLISLTVFLLSRSVSMTAAHEGAYSVWDASWYGSIVTFGYQYDANSQVQQNIAFFPLYPLLCFFVQRILGWPVHQAALTVSAFSTLFAFFFIYRLFQFCCSPGTARAALLLFALNPFALYFFNGYSEPVFLLLISLFFYCMLVRRSFFAAALMAGFASAARPYGCLLSILFAFELLREHWLQFGFRLTLESLPLRQVVAYTPLCFLGLISHTAWLGLTFGDPMAFSHAMKAWGSPVSRSVDLSHLFGFQHIPPAVAYGIRGQVIPGPFLVGLLLFLLAPVTVLLWRKVLPPVFLMFVAMMFLFFHYMGHHGYTMLLDVGRHMMVVFPLMLSLALLLRPSQIMKGFDYFYDDPDSSPTHCTMLATIPLLIVLMVFTLLFARHTILHYQHVFVS